MLRCSHLGARGVLVAAVVVIACIPLTSCDSRSDHADRVGYVAVVTSHKLSQRAVVVPAPKLGGASVAASKVTPIGPVPPYQVIAQRTSDRWDNATTYYIVLGPVEQPPAPIAPAGPAPEGSASGEPAGTALPLPAANPADIATGGFKLAVKQILRSLAVLNGGTKFSAHIWDEDTAAQTEVSYRAAPIMFSDRQYAAKQMANARHRIASYQGGIASPGQPDADVIFWFPEADVSDPVFGGLTSSEVWRP